MISYILYDHHITKKPNAKVMLKAKTVALATRGSYYDLKVRHHISIALTIILHLRNQQMAEISFIDLNDMQTHRYKSFFGEGEIFLQYSSPEKSCLLHYSDFCMKIKLKFLLHQKEYLSSNSFHNFTFCFFWLFHEEWTKNNWQTTQKQPLADALQNRCS